MNLFCLLFGHRFDYDLKISKDEIALACTRCGKLVWLIGIEVRPQKVKVNVPQG